MKKPLFTVLAGVITLSLLLSACGAPAEGSKTETAADNMKTEEQNEIPEGAMKIGSVADMEKFLKAVNEDGKTDQNAVLTADIDLSEAYGDGTEGWPGIQTYSGIFEGDGHCISGFVIQDPNANYTGFFIRCTEESCIRNVEIRDVTVEVSSGGVLVGASTGTVENCKISAVVKGSSVAGVAGNVEAVRDCLFSGTVEGEKNAAGIANRARTVENCRNEGSVTCTEGNDTTCTAAGIVGSFYNAEEDRMPELGGCVNTGTIYGNCVAGGIAGSVNDVTVTDCFNEGDVSGLLAGGIVGGCFEGKKDGAVIKNCGNSGHIMGLGVENADSYAGGVLGRLSRNNIVVNCYSNGTVESGYFAGGIVGQSYEDSQKIIMNCYSSGSITANLTDRSNTEASGIVAGTATECKNCYTMAEIGAVDVRAIWSERNKDPDGCYYIDTIQEIDFGEPVQTPGALAASAFTDGTLLELLNTGAQVLGEDVCGWKQGDQGPVFDWQ